MNTGSFRSHHGVDERRPDGQERGSRTVPFADPQGRPSVMARQQGTREQDRRTAESGAYLWHVAVPCISRPPVLAVAVVVAPGVLLV